MCWDGFVMRVPEGVSGVDEIPRDYEPPALGSRGAVHHQRVRDMFADVDWSDPGWGVLEGRTWVIELNVGREESVGLHVRGAGDDAVEAVARIADALVEEGTPMPWASPQGELEWTPPAAVTSKLRKRRSLVTEEYSYARARARLPLKATVPSPLVLYGFWSPTYSPRRTPRRSRCSPTR